MLVFFVLSAYVLANVYIIKRTLHFIRCYKKERMYQFMRKFFPVVYGFMSLVMVINYFIPEGEIHKSLQRFANYFEGTFMYLFGVYLLVDLGRILLKRIKVLKKHHLKHKGILSVLGVAVFAIAVTTSIYGAHHAKQIKVVSYQAAVHKKAGDLSSMKVVLIADTHLGYSVGINRVTKMVDLVNQQNADLIVFAGDIFDNTVDGIDEPDQVIEKLKQLKSKYGVYACWGNHDISERLFTGFSVKDEDEEKRSKQMERFVKDCNIKMLTDQVCEVENSVFLIGRKDYEKAGDGTNDRKELSRLMEQVDQSKPVFVIDHEPRKLQDVADAGTDIMFSGHTHDGQFFPLNISCDWIWENSHGMVKKDNMYSVVTSGIGVYGPDMRIGTDADITVVNVTFDK